MISASAMFTGVLGCFCTGMALRQPGYSTPAGLKSGEPLNEVIIFTHFDACHTYELEIASVLRTYVHLHLMHFCRTLIID